MTRYVCTGAIVFVMAMSLSSFAAECTNLPGVGQDALGKRDSSVQEPEATRPPNILFLLADDLGWADVGYQGEKKGVKTPNIDRLARDGMVFSDAYAACPVCSPTRASILTGRYPARLRLTSHIPSMGPDWTYGRPKDDAEFSEESGVATRNWLPLESKTVGIALRDLGYTTGFFGKWHLGHEPYHPVEHGFDVQAGTTNWGQPPAFYAPYRREWKRPGNPKGFLQIDDLAENAREGEYLTERLTDEAIRWIMSEHEKPWFCYLSYYTVHTPIQPRQDLLEAFGNGKGATYLAMIASLDASVGRMLTFLEDSGLGENTVVVFMSDNGGCQGNAPLRANKGSLYEGGIREPMIIRWPGVVEPGQTCSVPVISTDFYNTFVEIAGGDPAQTPAVDGMSLVPLLKGANSLPRESLYWHFPHRGAGNRGSAIRRGAYKLRESLTTGEVELFDLVNDTSEKNDLSEKMPEKTAELYAALQQWRSETHAVMPPGFKPLQTIRPKKEGRDNQSDECENESVD